LIVSATWHIDGNAVLISHSAISRLVAFHAVSAQNINFV